MASRKVEIGIVGQTVQANIAELRTRQGMTLRELSIALSSDHPLAMNTLSEIERGARRVDVDDLAYIALALDVPVNAILGSIESDRSAEYESLGREIEALVKKRMPIISRG